jgi:hypothetical protein
MELRARKEKPLRYKSLSGAIIPASLGYVNETRGCSRPLVAGLSGTNAPSVPYLPAIIG